MIDSSTAALDPVVVGVVFGMAVITVVTKVGGLWVLSHIDVSDRLEAGITALPGAIVVAILGPELASGGPAEWGAAGVAGLLMWRTENILLAMCAGLAALLFFRSIV